MTDDGGSLSSYTPEPVRAGASPAVLPDQDGDMDNLKHLISAYFYELWDRHEYSSWEAAVDDFVRRSPDRALRVPDEIDKLLAGCKSDEELAEQLEQWGFDAQPFEGERAWLSKLSDRIRAGLAATSA